MNEKFIKSLGNLLGMSQEELQKQLESSPEELANKVESIKVFDPNEADEVFNNRLKSLTADDVNKLPQHLTKSIFDNNKASVMESFERKLQQERGTSFEHGKDYKNAFELVGLIAETPKEVNVDYKNMLNEATTKHEDELKRVREEGKATLTNHILGATINGVRSKVQEPEKHEAKFKFLESQFTNNYELRIEDNKVIPYEKQSGKPVMDSDYKVKGVDSIIGELASTLLPITQQVPNGGRGSESEPPATPSATGKYKSVDEFIEKGLPEMGISHDDPRYYEEIEKFEAENA